MSAVERWLERMHEKAALVWGIATDRRLPWRARAPAALALAYVASPIDLIPDIVPGIGWLDDLAVLLIAALITPLMVPRTLVRKHAGLAEQRTAALRADPLVGGKAIVVLFWLLIVAGFLLALAALIATSNELGSL